jgi:cleavage and polyadenylation specificity factor subunit 3
VQAVCKLLLHDSVKIGNDEGRLWDETDLVAAMDKVELVNYHQVVSHKGIRFWCYNAGHVLGAAMFMIEIGGVRVLYTGDFSRQPDRHLLGAETPTEPPHVLIVESTYGVMEHEPRELRELRFTSAVHNIVKRGGRCLIPVFALGRSQELLLILDAYWRQHPELHRVPIYYASGIAKRCMRIYQTYINMMNDQVGRRSLVSLTNSLQPNARRPFPPAYIYMMNDQFLGATSHHATSSPLPPILLLPRVLPPFLSHTPPP